MRRNAKLIVEGFDDLHVVAALLKHHQFPDNFLIEEKGGVSEVLKVLPVQLKGSGIRAVGVLIDADENIQGRWQSITGILQNSGYVELPDSPPTHGLIIRQPNLPDFGAWLMPDNSLTGMLEDFVALLVPANDELWTIAVAAVDDIPREMRRFGPQHRCKVNIHTWLAWQDDPGTPMGLSITKKYLDADSPNCGPFLAWVRNLFNGDADLDAE